MSKTLYDEAIADAKRLREVAELNAKNAIVEAVTPRIREFIDSQLVGDTTKSVSAEKFLVDALNEGATDDSGEDEVVLDESALKSLVSLFTPKQTAQAKDSFQEAFDQLSDAEKKKLLNLISEEKSDADLEENEEESAPAQEKKMNDSLYEIDLNELKNELAAVASPGKPAVKPAGAAMPPRAGGMKKKMPAPAMEDMFEMDEDLYEMDMDSDLDEEYMEELNEMKLEVDLGDLELPEDFMPSVRVVPEEEEEDMLAADDGDMGDMAPDAEETPADEAPPAPVAETFYVDENMLRRELFRLREARKQKEDKLLNKKSLKSAAHVKAAAKAFGDGELEEVDEVEINALDNAKKHKLKKLKEARDNRALATQLNEYRSAVETLREQMTDMNLFNAKLLYVNKMLQSKDLTPKQQKVVIEAIDGAKTLREVKMLYKSLTESLTGGNGATLNESASRFNAGGSSRATSSAAARTTETTEVDRWARLAGLK